MNTLDRELRRKLDKTVREARRTAETGARKVLEQLAVQRHEPHGGMDEEARQLRNRLRAHARQLGDRRDPRRGTQAIDRLLRECAYEHWHRMLFARFRAESDLLIEPDSGVPISLEECRELAREECVDWLALASDYAERMLPQIFRKDSPVLAISLPPETRSHLERLLKDLPRDVFTAEDSLGWVYQFWQADQKDAVNRSGEKIGADELPAVTQLFTEDYMVLFLLHNTLGAWWAGKVLAGEPELAASAETEDELRAACSVGGVEWSYLRFVREKSEGGSEGPWRPAAGAFEGWPKVAKEITVIDPCMGSGHFLVFALPILVAFRIAEEELDETLAVQAVLRDNLFGLEIDPRCTQIAAFNLAFAAWRRFGFHPLPRLNLACSGLSIGVTKAEWLRLAEKAVQDIDPEAPGDLLGTDRIPLARGLEQRFKNGLGALYDLFREAPSLGSLIDPRNQTGDIFHEGFDTLGSTLTSIIGATDIDEAREMAVAAQGIGTAAEILGRQFVLAATNVPYLVRGKQGDIIRNFAKSYGPRINQDLATIFLKRCYEFIEENGTYATVSPNNWLFLKSYKEFRTLILQTQRLNLVAKVGSGSTAEASWDTLRALAVITRTKEDTSFLSSGINTDAVQDRHRADDLKYNSIDSATRKDFNNVPDYKFVFEKYSGRKLLECFAESLQGPSTGDFRRFGRFFWEVNGSDPNWEFQQSTTKKTTEYAGCRYVVKWDQGEGELSCYEGAAIRGLKAIGEQGIAVTQMRELPCSLFAGRWFDNNIAVLLPKKKEYLGPIWAFCSSDEYKKAVRQVDEKLGVTNASLVSVPFEIDKWRSIFQSRYDGDLPPRGSPNPAEWIHDGEINKSIAPLQNTVVTLMGYKWPFQVDSGIDQTTNGISTTELIDKDGIVCLSALRGEAPADYRASRFLASIFGTSWSAVKLSHLLARAGFADKSLHEWLRDGFFVQHCDLFHQRPFIWHIWDGLRDGFHALVNYHRLAGPNGEGQRTLDTLIYSYLGQWIDRQRAEQENGVQGADTRFAHANHLRQELIKIHKGEPPYDIFVRWKPLPEQPIGWQPDINDGIRVNIRPFMRARTFGAKAKNACILRTTPKVNWRKDRGKEPTRNKEDYPWFWGWDGEREDFAGGAEFDGSRWNDLHYSNAFKQAARERRQT